jgi:hypothetical protein
MPPSDPLIDIVETPRKFPRQLFRTSSQGKSSAARNLLSEFQRVGAFEVGFLDDMIFHTLANSFQCRMAATPLTAKSYLGMKEIGNFGAINAITRDKYLKTVESEV